MINDQSRSPHQRDPDREPSSGQFGLRGMLLVMTALCITLAAASWAGLNQARHLLGVGFIILFCAAMICFIELVRRFRRNRAMPFPHIPWQELDGNRPSSLSPFRGENPFRDEALQRPDAAAPKEEGKDSP